MVTSDCWVTPVVVIVNVVEVWFAGTTAVPYTAAAELLVKILTVVPPGPAGPDRVTVPVAVLPPITSDGATDSALSLAGLIDRLVDFAPSPVPADRFAVVWELTAEVVTLKVAVVEPAGMKTLPGTEAEVELDVTGTF